MSLGGLFWVLVGFSCGRFYVVRDWGTRGRCVFGTPKGVKVDERRETYFEDLAEGKIEVL